MASHNRNMEAEPLRTQRKPKEIPTFFTAFLVVLAEIGDGAVKTLEKTCEAACDCGRLLFKYLFVFAIFHAITTWRHEASLEPKILLIACCAGILQSNLGEVALGKEPLGTAVKYPLTVGLLLATLPIKAIAAAIASF